MSEKIVFPAQGEAEEALLGSALTDAGAASVVATGLDERDFTIAKNVLVFASIKRLYDRGIKIDATTVTSDMSSTKTIADIGGVDYLMELVLSCITPENAPYYVRMIKGQSLLRSFIKGCASVVNSYGKDTGGDPVQYVSEARIRLDEIASSGGSGDFEKSGEVAARAIESIEAEAKSGKNGLTGVDTGFIDLNEITHGLQPGDLVIAAGRPGMGKTAFAVNIAHNVAKTGKAVAFFSFEMRSEQIVRRILSLGSQVSMESMSTGRMSSLEAERLKRFANDLAGEPIYFNDSNTGLLGDVIADSNRLKVIDPRFGLVIIDYLGLMSLGMSTDNRVVEIQRITRSLKLLARSLEVPVLLLCQLNRDAENGDGQAPGLTNLRDSGAIEQDADLVLLLHRLSYYDAKRKGEAEPPSSIEDVYIAKSRNGRTGKVQLFFDRARSSFSNVTRDFQSKQTKIVPARQNRTVHLDEGDE